MVEYISRAAGNGAKYTGVMALIAAFGQSLSWEGAGQHPGGMLMLLLGFVPALACLGAIAGCGIFAVSGLIVYQSGRSRTDGILAYAILGGLLSLLLLLPFSSWVAGGIAPALRGAKGTYLVLFPGLLVAIVAGALVGWRLKPKSGS